ncbi:MAG: COR domain-containing protein [Candidatus Electryonea clarkiae]|nr:COR domain-containing protein [Candidatus Electryonea clarkiae]MDP8287954.1 COR domain-containing protein [Candidatus Electryonea clarkiae]
MNDLQRIKQLEKEIGINLELTDFDTIMEINNGYSIDKNQNVIGLNFDQFMLENIPQLLFSFQYLSRFSLYGNKLSKLPKEISELKNLQTLDICSNQLTELPNEISELKNLQTLDISSNQLTELPKEILEFDMEIRWEFASPYKGIFLEDNPLESPPIEIVKKGKDAVRAYFESLEGERRALNEVKVILVGDGGAGKTSLVKRLLGNEFDKNESQTHGINIDNWLLQDGKDKVKVNIWDFGGQEIMHATHQFFLSKRSLYILVLDGRKDEKTEYWLKHIESFGGDSPVLVVINKIDENPGFDVNRPFLQDKYEGIKGFYRISCAEDDGIEQFKEQLSEELLQLEMRKTPFAKSWFEVKKQLEEMKEDFISCERYKEICAEAGVDEQTAQDTLVDYLNDLGIALHFKDFELDDVHVLEPGWATGAVYKIINSTELADNNGILKMNRLKHILKQREGDKYFYPQDKFKFIIELMKKFELCYEMKNKSVLIPDLTKVAEPPFGFNYGEALKFRIDYDFLPKSVMPRFIVNMHEDIKGKLLWRTGVVLEDKDFKSQAVIKADEVEKRIFIYVSGDQKRDYFAVILSTFRKINGSFEKLNAVEKICLPDQQNIPVSYQHLVTQEGMGVKEFVPEGAGKLYNVQELLGTISIIDRTEEEMLQILRKLKDKFNTEDSLLNIALDIFSPKLKAGPAELEFKLVKVKDLVKKIFSSE